MVCFRNLLLLAVCLIVAIHFWPRSLQAQSRPSVSGVPVPRASAHSLTLFTGLTSQGGPAAAPVKLTGDTKPVQPPALTKTVVDPQQLAAQVKIYRDSYGVPHIDGENDAAVVFGFAYAQAEDFFWQVEDSYILALGRYSEVYGHAGLNSDLLNRAFEIVPTSLADFSKLPEESQRLCAAFAAGLNYYLYKHPEVRPRLIQRFEPWHVLAFVRHMTLELCFRYTRLYDNYLPRNYPRVDNISGSNAFAIGPSRTASGNAMLLINPHQPWFGFGQMVEAHLRSQGSVDSEGQASEGWNFTGATFFGNPLPSIGHNEHLGWAFTTNEPDIADVWRVEFDDPDRPLHYRYGDGYRIAVQWRELIGIRAGDEVVYQEHTFRKTHHGPIIVQESSQSFLAARIAKLYHTQLFKQGLKMLKAQNLEQFKSAFESLHIPCMNVIYADRDKNIFYLYNGVIPRRNPEFDWSQPVDGSNPSTEWQGYHTVDELPQLLNPEIGYLQNCNSSPFTTTSAENPQREAFPHYMAEDRDDDKRRAKRARELLESLREVTLPQFKSTVFDTTVYWARHEMPAYQQTVAEIRDQDPLLADRVQPYLDHLLAWDGVIRFDSTAATLCQAWYEELHGLTYPGETMREHLADDPAAQLQALVTAANLLSSIYGTWKVPWGEVHRMQRPAFSSDLLRVPFDESEPSLPSLGGHGPMGVLFTQYNTPSIYVPFLKKTRQRFGLIGATYISAIEFGDRIESRSLINFGQSGDPESPHFFDQATLLSEARLKPALFYWEDVLAQAVHWYHPGQSKQLLKQQLSPAEIEVEADIDLDSEAASQAEEASAVAEPSSGGDESSAETPALSP